ncbi:MAG: nucleotidyl transferase AbiEii/AbiGii toxin family protein [Alphaproteobacteria bacterium CG_4_9_14_3_um_filter_47_13]|nr:MAG: nucleotidyl transferase AbiEii/AbiGii toxin family protein [Alphaproteobacteria bacterium CG_4_9_14_3_um_filter_47_13]
MISETYRAQVDLLLQVLPHVAKEESFALKGGTAINLFVRDMPRLSVDIDLTYLPFEDRATALAGITEALRRVKARVEAAIPACRVALVPQSDGQEAKLTCKTQNAQIKVEVNTTIRGNLLPPRIMDVTDTVESEFGRFMAVNVVSHAELFGGKICAALDRQHPRDLFDVHHMLTNEGLTNDIRMGFMASLLSHSRPIHEMIRPNFQDQGKVFETQFAGMAFTPFSYADFEATRERLVQEINKGWSDNDRAFLLGFKQGKPDWNLFPLENLSRMPAVQWKLLNIQKLIKQNPDKHAEQFKALKERLSS